MKCHRLIVLIAALMPFVLEAFAVEYRISMFNNGVQPDSASLHDSGSDVFAPDKAKYAAENGYDISEFVIDETAGVPSDYTRNSNATVGRLVYKRELNENRRWNALYVPFKIAVDEEFLAKYDVAYINAFCSYDINEDGVIDENDKIEMEAVLYTAPRTLRANYPYLIRAKGNSVDDRMLTIEYEGATLYYAYEYERELVTMNSRFVVKGTYKQLQPADILNSYVMVANGYWCCTDASLNPYRFYFNILNEDGESVVMNGTEFIAVRVEGEESEDDSTGIDYVPDALVAVEGIFDLQGRKIEEITEPGIYIIDGKKTLVKAE